MASAIASPSLNELPFQMVRMPKMLCRPRKCTAILACCDALGLLFAICAGYLITLQLGGTLEPGLYLRLWPALPIFFAVFAALRLYPGIVYNGVTELERSTAAVSVSFMMFAALAFMDHGPIVYSRSVFLIAWATAIVAIPLFRALVRARLSHTAWWGVPVVVFHTGEESRRMLRLLETDKRIGIKVVAVLASPEVPQGHYAAPVLDLRHAYALRVAGIRRALIALPEHSAGLVLKKLEVFENMFPKLMLVSDAFSHYSLSAAAQEMDIADQGAIRALFVDSGFQSVVHLAAQAGVRYSLDNPRAYVDSNVVGFLNILEGVRHHPCKHLVFASSSSVYGANTSVPFRETDTTDHPVSLYAATKKSNEGFAHAYSHLYGIPMTGLRFFTVYGPWGRPDMAIFKFVDAILAGEPIQLYNNGQLSRDFTYIDDIVEGIVRVLDKLPTAIAAPDKLSDAKLRILNIGNNRPVEVLHMVRVIEEALGVQAKVRLAPMAKGDVYTTFASVDDLAELTGYSPVVRLEEGVAEFVSWYRSYYGIPLERSGNDELRTAIASD